MECDHQEEIEQGRYDDGKGNTQEMEASLSTAKVSSSKIFPSFSGSLRAFCARLPFFAAKKGGLGEFLKDPPKRR